MKNNTTIQKYFLWLMACSIAIAVTFGEVPADRSETAIDEETLEKEHRSRYHINYASYLIDVGKYLEALENYEAAEELTAIPKTKIDALLAKATLLSSFLDAPEQALKVYRTIGQQYPHAAEIAKYREGMLLYHLNRSKPAQTTLNSYLQTYPSGRYRFQTQALLREIAKAGPGTVPSSQPSGIPPVAAAKPVPQTQKPRQPVSKPPDRPAAPAPTGLPKPAVPPPVIPPVAVAKPSLPKPAPVTPVPSGTPGPAALSEHPKLRVRMCKTTRNAYISGTKVCVDGKGCKDRFKLGVTAGKLQVDGAAAPGSTMTFQSTQPLTVQCGKKKKRVRGILKARIHKGKLLVLNIIDIEAYLLSVVPSENPATWPVEALKAQAVAARTYAYYQRQHRKNWSYDLVDYAGDQAYEGMAKEHRRSTKAVKATSGQILTHKGKPILAMYSANSGGYTADSKAIFNLHKPYLTAQKDPASLKGSMANWTRKFKVSDVVARLKKIRINAKGLRKIEAHQRGPSGRIVKIRLVLAGGKTKVLRNRTTLRRALDLPEILHKIRLDGDTYVFKGHGWGHGVGYSQWGSAHMGKRKKYNEILSFYYGDANLVKHW